MAADIVFRIEELQIDAVTLLDRKRLVEDFFIEIKQGQITGLVGETGAGKSISMMASVGLLGKGLEVKGGTVFFNGRLFNAKERTALRANLARGVSLLFQNAKGALNPYHRAKAQIERVLRLNNVLAKQRTVKVNELLLSVGLDPAEIGPKYAHEVSGGQAQRIAIACALATSPKLLIADEPTTALDVTTEREVLGLLKNLCQERNMAMVLIAHNLALVAENCDHVSILHAGHVVEMGPVQEIINNPLHPYTKGLISAIPDVDEPKELVPLIGTVWGGQSLENRCRFSHRCAFVTPQCEERIPSLIRIGDHGVRCVLYQ